MKDLKPNYIRGPQTKKHCECDDGGCGQRSFEEIFNLINQTAKRMKQIQQQTVKDADLTPAQYYIMTVLWERDDRPLKELASACNCSRATITGIIDALESKGMVCRKRHPKDRRSLLASLTDKGRALRESTPKVEKMFDNCCRGLSPEEFQELARLLTKLNNSLA